jgi:hypothetical protein
MQPARPFEVRQDEIRIHQTSAGLDADRLGLIPQIDTNGIATPKTSLQEPDQTVVLQLLAHWPQENRAHTVSFGQMTKHRRLPRLAGNTGTRAAL